MSILLPSLSKKPTTRLVMLLSPVLPVAGSDVPEARVPALPVSVSLTVACVVSELSVITASLMQEESEAVHQKANAVK